MSDHGHLLCEVDPQFGIHRLVKNIKGVSSHRLRKRILDNAVSNSYVMDECFFGNRRSGVPPLAVIQPYLENQKDAGHTQMPQGVQVSLGTCRQPLH